VIISLLVSEKILDYFLSGSALNFFTKPSSRVLYIHLPLACIGFIIGYIKKTPGFIWFATLVVFAETAIVITRYVFYYEQAFMGDLVRLWYAAIFLFSSGYTLLKDGHVRVDILYVKFSEKGKAIANIAGSILFGIPLCALTLFFGLQGRTSIINAPVLSFEITQQGVSGMYIKYLLAAFLAIFAITMIFQFASLILTSLNQILKRTS
jgi:TRAP-type mannitol/chloroaromatic compound transport system permease small subunit